MPGEGDAPRRKDLLERSLAVEGYEYGPEGWEVTVSHADLDRPPWPATRAPRCEVADKLVYP